MAEFVFTWEDASQMPQEQQVVCLARQWFEQVRAMMKHHDWEGYNMMHTSADWRAWLARHPRGREIVGPGVRGFEVRYLNSRRPPHPCRYEFLVRRVDGTDACVHPRRSDDSVIIGRVEDWLPDQASAAPRGLHLHHPNCGDLLRDPGDDIGIVEILFFLDAQWANPRARIVNLLTILVVLVVFEYIIVVNMCDIIRCKRTNRIFRSSASFTGT